MSAMLTLLRRSLQGVRPAGQGSWSLHPRDNDWRWVRDEVRLDVDHVTWWETPVRPVLALIYNRPWQGRAAQAAAQGRDYKVAQHASSHVQGQATSKESLSAQGQARAPETSQRSSSMHINRRSS